STLIKIMSSFCTTTPPSADRLTVMLSGYLRGGAASATSRIRARIGGRVPHPPVLPFGEHRFPRMGAQPMPDVAVIVVVAHQRGDVPTDPAEEAVKASH